MSGVGRIFKRGDRYWIAFYRHGREIRKSARTTSEKLARKFLQSQIRTSLLGHEEKVTYDDLVELVKADYEVRGLRTKYDLEKSRLPHLQRSLGGLRAVDITSGRLRKYAADRKRQGAANSTINSELRVISRGFRLAIEDGALSQRPHIGRLPETNVRQGFVSETEFRSILAKLPADKARPSDTTRDILEFLYLTGWRLSEALTLEWRDLENDTISLRAERSKTAKGRSIPMRGPLAGILARRREARRIDCRFVFHHQGKPYARGSVSRSFRRAADKCRLPFIVHDLRRTAARNFNRAGIPVKVAMELMGHKTLSMHMRYRIVAMDEMGAAQERLGEYLESAPREANVRVLSALS